MRKFTRSDRSAALVSEPASPSTDPKRRRFLFTLGVGSAGAAAAAAFPASAATDVVTAEPESDAKYRETAHVRDYYRTAKL